MKLGDKFTMSVPVRRRWWQVWKPKQKFVETRFEIVSKSFDFSETSVIAANIQAEKLIRKWRIEDLTQQIDTARRNKKKSSHLVAELKKLEEQK